MDNPPAVSEAHNFPQGGGGGQVDDQQQEKPHHEMKKFSPLPGRKRMPAGVDLVVVPLEAAQPRGRRGRDAPEAAPP